MPQAFPALEEYHATADVRVFAESETNTRNKLQMEGIARAKANGVYVGKGRPASIDSTDSTRVRALKAQGLGPTAIAKELGIGWASVYRLLEARSG